MAESKDGQRMRVDSALLRELAKMLSDNDLTEIEVEDGDRKIKVRREGAPMMAYTPAPQAAPATPAPAEAAPAAPVDAVKAISTPVILVHLTDPETREAFRHTDLVALAATQLVKGQGPRGYLTALDAAARL